MRATTLNKLTPLAIKNAKPNGVLSDGGGLYLRKGVWVFRYTSPLTGKETDLSLGSAQSLAVKDARVIATRHRSLLAEKKDPRSQIAAEHQAAVAEVAAQRTFGDIAQLWCDEVLPNYKSERNRRMLRAVIATHTKSLSKLLMTDVSSKMIADCVKPLVDRPSQRDNVVSLVHSIFEWAMNSDMIPERPNPARRGKLKKLVPSRTRPIKHNTFVALEHLPAFVRTLEGVQGNVARALEFLIHTGLRTVEVTSLRWAYVNLDDRSITIPASAMKAGKAHSVFLSERAHEIIVELIPQRRSQGFVFPGNSKASTVGAASLRQFMVDRFPHLGRAQPHGARASLKTWATAKTHHRREIVELTLAHSIGGVIEATYFRDDDPAVRKAREALYRDWSAFLRGSSNVIPFASHAA
jgi:integrase